MKAPASRKSHPYFGGDLPVEGGKLTAFLGALPVKFRVHNIRIEGFGRNEQNGRNPGFGGTGPVYFPQQPLHTQRNGSSGGMIMDFGIVGSSIRMIADSGLWLSTQGAI